VNDFAVRADLEGVLWLAGEFDLAAIDAFQAAVDAVLDAQRELVLDLSELTFLDSTGIRAFLVVAGQVRGGVILRRPTQTVRRVLDLVGIDGHLGIRIEE
jgi:anti-sigma B factor antagonist